MTMHEMEWFKVGLSFASSSISNLEWQQKLCIALKNSQGCRCDCLPHPSTRCAHSDLEGRGADHNELMFKDIGCLIGPKAKDDDG